MNKIKADKRLGFTSHKVDKLPEFKTWDVLFDEMSAHEKLEDGMCWLRPRCVCPFSRRKLASLQPALEKELVDEVSRIHQMCADPATHLRSV